MIDRICSLKKNESATAIKTVSFSEDILHDHFPEYPIFPGSLIIEAMAQLGGFLLEMSLNKPESIRRALLVQIESAKFHLPAEPGDTIVLTTHLQECMKDAAKISAVAEVSGKKIATARLMFVMKAVDLDKIHEQRRYLYKIWTRHCDGISEIL